MSQQSASSPAPRVIVTYQRGDAEPEARRLIRTLRCRFGGGGVKTCYDFAGSDLFSLRGGAGGSPVVLAVIGRRWRKAARGLSPGDTHAHATVAVALMLGLDVIAVPVKGATISAAEYSQHVRLRDARWEEDVERLVGRLEGLGVAASGDAGASDDFVKVYLRRDDAVKLATALTLYMGAAPVAPRGLKKGASKSLIVWGDRAIAAGGKVVGSILIIRPEESEAGPDASQKEIPADVVSCTVFSPPRVAAGATFLVQVFAHLPEEAERAAGLAREAVKDAEKLGSKTLESEVGRGTKLRFDLSLPGLSVDEPGQDLIWRGRPEAVQFGVAVAPTHTPGNVIGTVRVSQGGVPFGHVKFQLTVAAPGAAAPAPQPQPTRDWVRYKKAFVSYASKDRDEVLKRAQVLARLTGEVFVDFITLEPGERWERGLYKHIDESDVFFLFWSTNAKRSRWVMKEVDYALARKGADEAAPPEIIPMVIEGPPPVEPPRRLSHLHFDDMFLRLMTRPEKAAPKRKGRPRSRRQP